MSPRSLRISLSVIAAVVLMLPSVATPDTRAGGSERLMAAAVGRLTIFRGSDLGTICYEMIVRSPFDPSGGGPFGSHHVGVYTEPPQPPSFDFPGGTRIFSIHIPSYDEVHTGCIGGLSQAIVTDIFANPGEYWYTVTTCFQLVGCGSGAEPFAPEGSACVLSQPRAEEFDQNITANEVFSVRGEGFIPGSTAVVTFTPSDPAEPPGSLSVEVTEYSTIDLELAATDDQVGDWTIEATGPGGCQDVESLRILPPEPGSSFPDGVMRMPGGTLASGGGPLGETPGPLLPDTAMARP